MTPMPDCPPPLSQSPKTASGFSIYVCSALMVLPTLLGGVFCLVVLMPKLRAFQHTVESMHDQRSHVASDWNGISDGVGIGIQIALATLILIFVFLELRVQAWKRVRHWVVLGSASLVNFVFVVFVIWIAITTSILGPLAGVKSAQKKHIEEQQKK